MISAVKKMHKCYENKLQGDYTHSGRLHRILWKATEGELRGGVSCLRERFGGKKKRQGQAYHVQRPFDGIYSRN